MRKITFGLIALVSLALDSAVFAEVDEAHNLVTGTVVSVDVRYMEIDTHEANATNFGVFVEKWGSYKPKVGDNVRVYIRPGGRRVYADKIEKVGTANKGSTKN